jgi:hypothetical protein
VEVCRARDRSDRSVSGERLRSRQPHRTRTPTEAIEDGGTFETMGDVACASVA